MSHKAAKLKRRAAKMSNEMRIAITFSEGKGVTVTFPSNSSLAIFMMAEALKVIGQHSVFKAPSPIVQVPPGVKVGQ